MSDLQLDALPKAPSGIAVPVEAHPEAPAPRARVRLLATLIVLVMGGLLAFLSAWRRKELDAADHLALLPLDEDLDVSPHR